MTGPGDPAPTGDWKDMGTGRNSKIGRGETAPTSGETAPRAVSGTAPRGKSGAAATPPPADLHGPSPNVATNLAIADIALRGGAMLARQAVERTLLGRRYAPRKARAILKGRSLPETLLHGALARVALRSVPGAIIVGGALLAKTLYDRSQSHDARAKGEQALDEMARDGEDETGNG